MNWDLIIRNAMVVAPDGAMRRDIAVSDGRIAELGEEMAGDAREVIDAKGMYIFPGVLDPHVHFNEPGRSEWEGFETGSSALAAGGGTCFFDMPLNASPPTLDAASFRLKQSAAERSSRTDFGLWGGLTPGNLDQMAELAECGVVGFKAFMCASGIDDFSQIDDMTLYRGMQMARKLDLPVAVHAESEEITARLTAGAQARGATGWADYLATRPPMAEEEATARAVALAADTGCRLHVVHVSHPRAAALVRLAAAHGLADVSCETCPHYLTFNETDLPELGARAKCAPPLRAAADVEQLWKDLVAGTLDFVASDHSPSPASMKQSSNAFACWGGIAGVQSTLNVLLTHRPGISPEMVAALTADHAARRFSIAAKGRIERGFDADFALVLLDEKFQLKQEQLLDRHRQSPYVGRIFTGAVQRTIVRGTTVYRDGRAVGTFRGRLVRPNARLEGAHV